MIHVSILAFLASTAAFAAIVNAQSWSVGDGMVTYQILLSNWHNPNGVTYTGQRCDQIGSKCDTQFKGDFEIFGCNATEQRRMNQLSWPGPNDAGQWRRIGKRKYDPNSLKDFAYVNLTGVDCANFCGIMVRMEVIDVDPLHNDLIDKYIGTLPGCQDLQIARYENQAQFSLPVALESISIALPQVPRHHTPSIDAIQQHQLHMKVRAWGMGGSTQARQPPYSPYGTGSRTQYSASNNNDDSSTSSPMYGANRDRSSSSGRNIGTSFGSSNDRQAYPSQSSSTYTQRRTYSSGTNP